MNKKLIDILEMIAQGEQIRFICNGCEYHTDKVGRILNDNNQYVEWFIYKDWLNEEVEIIEETKKIQNIKLDEEECIEYYEDGVKKHLNTNKKDKMYIKLINEIIDELNKLGDK